MTLLLLILLFLIVALPFLLPLLPDAACRFLARYVGIPVLIGAGALLEMVDGPWRRS